MASNNAARLLGAPVVILMALAACGRKPATPAADARSTAVQGEAATTRPVTVDVNAGLRASAEPFEKLTETAFTTPMTTLDQTISEATAAADRSRASLAPDAAKRLHAQLAAMTSARQRQDRAGLALASIEAYRVLVNGVTADAKSPTAVSLLDYAGFRYDADLKAGPARWGDMKQAVAFARQTSGALAAKSADPALMGRMDKVVAEMDKAASDHDAKLAASSVKTELDLVDQLEKAFSAK